MRIVLSGIETNNKGAELMLYAILQEIERRHPQAEVFVPLYAVRQGLDYIDTRVALKDKPYARVKRMLNAYHVTGALRRIHAPHSFLLDSWPVRNADYLLDASGFLFSDQWHIPLGHWKRQLHGYRKQGTHIVFLPQAFGPANNPATQEALRLLNETADIIMPRDKTSRHYLENAGICAEKLYSCGDFTALTKGVPPPQLEQERGICIIPNIRMIDKGGMAMETYVQFIKYAVEQTRQKGLKAFILNHEGEADNAVASMLQKQLGENVNIISGLNALQVKGVIAQSHICITSRFHGAVSAINSCVPCLATSWSHKYVELFDEFGIGDFIINLEYPDKCKQMIDRLLDDDSHEQARQEIKRQLPKRIADIRKMWDIIWNLDCV